MSELSVTKITDRVGTGKVNFSQGFKVAGTLDTTLAPTRTEGNTEPETPVNGDTWYDTDNDTYDVYINDEWKRFIGAGGGGSWTVDLSNVTYDSVSFNADLQESTPHAFAFNADGTKMYILGINNDTVYQYSLSTAFDISTGSYDSVGFSITNQEGAPYAITFNTDGTKMYVVGDYNDRAYQYSLTTGFDVSTASYDNVSFNFTSQDTLIRSMAFNSDGTKMYAVGQSNQKIFQYSLTTGFDVSTASYDNVSFSTTSQDAAPFDIRFSASGHKMYFIGRGNEYIYQYSTGL